MRDSSTRCTHTTCFDLHIPKCAPNEKLEFVEHVLGVLIESRYGNSNPYTRLGDQPVTTGHSQMFANITLLELPLASANGAWLSDRSGFSPKAVWAKAREIVAALNRRLKPTAIPLARGSPDISGTFFFASSFASLATFA
ncbi:MAG: hypothetical protein ABL959_18150 [Pyrinomonadaceae bacterium]